MRHESTDGDEEMDNYTMTRMLEDTIGTLLFVGDASNISFLQLLRMVVETAAGPCEFTLDPRRHRLDDRVLITSLQDPLVFQLPKRDTALVLVQSFFTNVGSLPTTTVGNITNKRLVI